MSSDQQFSFFISKIKIFLFTYRGFHLTLHVDFFSTNDKWHHRTCGVAHKCPHLCSMVSLSFSSRWLRLCPGFFCLALYKFDKEPNRRTRQRKEAIWIRKTDSTEQRWGQLRATPHVRWCHLSLVLKSMWNVRRNPLQVKKDLDFGYEKCLTFDWKKF